MKNLFSPTATLATIVLSMGILGAGQITNAATTDTTHGGTSKNLQKSIEQVQKSIRLGSVTVTADLYRAMQTLKVALKRPESSDPADANKLVCRLRPKLGTHFHEIACATNRALRSRRDRSQISWIAAVDALRTASPGDHAATALRNTGILQTGFEFPANSKLMYIIHAIPAPSQEQATK